jgi:hypothetical protein
LTRSQAFFGEDDSEANFLVRQPRRIGTASGGIGLIIEEDKGMENFILPEPIIISKSRCSRLVTTDENNFQDGFEV